MKRKICTRAIAVLLATALLTTTTLQGTDVKAQEVTEISSETCSEPSYEISKQITSQWENGYVATITIRNTGDTVINNWALYFTVENEIENVWNGTIDCYDGFGYTVTNAGWNENIQPNSSVSFGFITKGEGSTAIEECELLYFSGYNDSEFDDITNKDIKDVLKSDGVTDAEINDYIQFVKDGANQEPSTRGIGSAVKKAIVKAVKFMVKHVNVIPSKKVRKVFKKYGGKIVKAFDTLDTWTWYGIARALTAVGVPDNVADLIADFIIEYLL